MLNVSVAMEHIADHNNVVGFKILNLGYEALHVFLENALWHGNACLSKMAGLAQVKI